MGVRFFKVSVCAAGLSACASVSVPPGATNLELVVCSVEAAGDACAFYGGDGLQAAVDAAEDGTEIHIRAGRYVFNHYRDVPFVEHEPDNNILNLTIRTGVLVDGKDVSLLGEPGVIFDGAAGIETSAIVIRNAQVRISGVHIENFRASSTEDSIYDGHGIFVINGDVDVSRVTIEGMAKMALTARGDSDVDARDVRLIDNHLGVWAEEMSNISLRNVVIRASEEAGVAAYDTATVKIYNSVIEDSLDDGLYSHGRSHVVATNSLILTNAPYGLRAVEESEIVLRYSVLFANEADVFAGDGARVDVGDHVVRADPEIGENYQPYPGSPLVGAGDPNGRSYMGDAPTIGVFSAPSTDGATPR